ncbi:MAG: hypothetical protein AAF335_02145 [Bacteroidota bacterium]
MVENEGVGKSTLIKRLEGNISQGLLVECLKSNAEQYVNQIEDYLAKNLKVAREKKKTHTSSYKCYYLCSGHHSSYSFHLCTEFGSKVSKRKRGKISK